MENIGSVISSCFKMLNSPINLFGFSISLFSVLLSITILGLTGYLIGRLFR